MSRVRPTRRVLIVDDDESILLSLEWLLENAGYQTTLAWNGAEAKRLLASRCFDVVFVDAALADVSPAEIANCARSGAAQWVFLDHATRILQVDSVCGLGGLVQPLARPPTESVPDDTPLTITN